MRRQIALTLIATLLTGLTPQISLAESFTTIPVSIAALPIRLAGVAIEPGTPHAAVVENTTTGAQDVLEEGDSLSQLGIADARITKIASDAVVIRLSSGQTTRLWQSQGSSIVTTAAQAETAPELDWEARREAMRQRFLESITGAQG